jgi:ABC-type transporter Mla subunit MlaD
VQRRIQWSASRPMAALSFILVAAIVAGWLGLAALWWFGFRGRGSGDD